MIELVPLARLGDWRYPELAAIEVAAHDAARDLLVLAGSLPSVQYGGRGVAWPRRRHRVVVYRASSGARLGVLDELAYPVAALALHPARDELALATGAYDGGDLHEGQLVIWAWPTGVWHSELTESRRVTDVAYGEDGAQLAFVVVPYDEEAPDLVGGPTAHAIAAPIAGSRRGWPQTPTSWGEPDARLRPTIPPGTAGLGRAGARSAAAFAACAPPARDPIWDLAWLDDGHLACARDGGLELWHPATGARTRVPVPLEGGARQARVLELLAHPTRGLQAHVEIERTDTFGASAHLFALASDHRLVHLHALPARGTCSIDARGRILARGRDREARADRVFAADGRVAWERDLGTYDVFNHALRVNGGAELYFLRGAANTHVDKQLWAIGDDLEPRLRWAWDRPAAPHLMGSFAACYGDDLVRVARVYSPRSDRPLVVERLDLATGEAWWSLPLGRADALALALWPAADLAVIALDDRTLAFVDLDRGRIAHAAPFAIDGATAQPTALAVHDAALAVATIDGRVVVEALR